MGHEDDPYFLQKAEAAIERRDESYRRRAARFGASRRRSAQQSTFENCLEAVKRKRDAIALIQANNQFRVRLTSSCISFINH